jgi:hypothetical protein
MPNYGGDVTAGITWDVIAWLDPAIHPIKKSLWKMDARVKPAYDG